jgi:hypothetical protein
MPEAQGKLEAMGLMDCLTMEIIVDGVAVGRGVAWCWLRLLLSIWCHLPGSSRP